MSNNLINSSDPKQIVVSGARLHNLKDISAIIPRNTLTVITGVSGSGKSTLAFDTIYAEGQRRFVQSLSAYARQFLERMNKPDVDSILGLPPAIAIEQRPASKNPRSTVGTNTEIYDYLRLLFGRIGTTYCRKCNGEVRKDTPDSIVKDIMKSKEGDKVYIMFPLPPNARNLKSEFKKMKELGFFRAVTEKSDDIINFEEATVPKGTLIEDVYILVDRLVVNKDNEMESRLAESVEAALNAGEGKMILRNLQTKKQIKYS